MKITYKKLAELVPYENNPRDNADAVLYVAASIQEFGFKVPIVITAEGVIVAGHTRYLAAQQIGLAEVPCIVADDLTEEQVKAYRLADNKTAEMSAWDMEKLEQELAAVSMFAMDDFGFDLRKESEEELTQDPEQPEIERVVCPRCGKVFEVVAK
jgi:ParB-like chromosome segregation protein Spo0J